MAGRIPLRWRGRAQGQADSGGAADHHAGTTWAPSGATPVVKATGARYGFNLLSAVNARGHFRFKDYPGEHNDAKRTTCIGECDAEYKVPW